MLEPPQSGRLVAFRSDRLGARLISLVNALRLAQDYDLPMGVHWQQATDIGQAFNDPGELFAADFVAHRFIDLASFRARRGEAARLRDLISDGPDAVRDTLAEGRDVLVELAFGLALFPG
ncbi:MAG: hypothetical protein AAGI70_16775, partial [Pseudomonadota bacterium]